MAFAARVARDGQAEVYRQLERNRDVHGGPVLQARTGGESEQS